MIQATRFLTPRGALKPEGAVLPPASRIVLLWHFLHGLWPPSPMHSYSLVEAVAGAFCFALSSLCVSKPEHALSDQAAHREGRPPIV